MKHLLIILMVFTAARSYASTSDTTTPGMDIPPKFKGDLVYFIQKNIYSVSDTGATRCEGRIVIHFFVEPDGTLSDIHAAGLGPDCTAWYTEAERVIKKSAGRWEAALLNGKKVRAAVSQNIMVFIPE